MDTEKEIWVYGDLRNSHLFGYSLNVLSKARDLARMASAKTVMLLMGACEPEGDAAADASDLLPIARAQEEALSHGADRVCVFENPDLAVPRSDIHARILASAVKERAPVLVLFALTDFGRETAARAAGICRAGLIADCAGMKIHEGAFVAQCPAWGGEILAEITYADPNRPGFATVQAHGYLAEQVKSPKGTADRMPLPGRLAPKDIRLISSGREPAAHRKLEEADVIVVGGAGLGSMEGFGQVRRLAAAMGGEVGATRPPVLHHWVDEDRLIGQTGKSVRPRLLLSIGTSGAVQYTAGIMEARTIVAVNRDPNAQIFQVADLGVVADAGTFVPVLTAKAKQAVMRQLADVLSEDRFEGNQRENEFGDKIRKLREAQGWSAEVLADKTGQSPEFIGGVEAGDISPPVSVLVRLANALGTDPGTFLHNKEQTALRDLRTRAYMERTQNYNYQTLTDGGENDHLRAFMITIEPHHAHKPIAYKHEGEEFIFVMEGKLELTLGNKAHHLKPCESMHFNSDIPHKLKSLSNEITRCLVILYTV